MMINISIIKIIFVLYCLHLSFHPKLLVVDVLLQKFNNK